MASFKLHNKVIPRTSQSHHVYRGINEFKKG